MAILALDELVGGGDLLYVSCEMSLSPIYVIYVKCKKQS